MYRLWDGIANQQYPAARGREKEFVAERLALHNLPRSSVEQELPGDRWVRAEEQRTADGGVIGVRVDVTELKSREASFRLLFEHNPIPMWVLENESMRFLAVNDAAIKHYGFSREQFLAMDAYEIRPAEDRQFTLVEHLDLLLVGTLVVTLVDAQIEESRLRRIRLRQFRQALPGNFRR